MWSAGNPIRFSAEAIQIVSVREMGAGIMDVSAAVVPITRSVSKRKTIAPTIVRDGEGRIFIVSKEGAPHRERGTVAERKTIVCPRRESVSTASLRKNIAVFIRSVIPARRMFFPSDMVTALSYRQ
jgi:hypothetical protein